MTRRTLAALPLVAVAVTSLPSAAQATRPTKVQTTVTGLPSMATLGTPIPITVKVTNRGPAVVRGIEVQVGVDKDSGAGADPGLDVGPYDGLQAHIAKLEVGRSKSFTFHVTIPATAPASQKGTIGAAYVGPGGYNIGVGLQFRNAAAVKCAGECTKDVSVANITLNSAP